MIKDTLEDLIDSMTDEELAASFKRANIDLLKEVKEIIFSDQEEN